MFTPDEQGQGLGTGQGLELASGLGQGLGSELASGPGLGQVGVATVEAPARLVITRARTRLVWSRGGYSVDVGEPLLFNHNNDEDEGGNGSAGNYESVSGGSQSVLVTHNNYNNNHSSNSNSSNISSHPQAVLVYARDGTPVNPYPPSQPTLHSTPSQDLSSQDIFAGESGPPSWVKYYLSGVAPASAPGLAPGQGQGLAPGLAPGQGSAQGQGLASGQGLAQGSAQEQGLEGAKLLPQGYVFTHQQMGRQTLTAVFDPR